MPIIPIRNSITNMRVDAIVNSANKHPIIGKGVDYVIYHDAGDEQLLEERKKIGDIEKGCAAYTSSGLLKEKGIKHIIHTVGPNYDIDENAHEILKNCYRSSLNLAKELGCKSIAFPVISTGIYGYPKDKAFLIALNEIAEFLINNEMDIYIVVYDKELYNIAKNIFLFVDEYIDNPYVDNNRCWEYGTWGIGNEHDNLMNFLNSNSRIEKWYEDKLEASFSRERIGIPDTVTLEVIDNIMSRENNSFYSTLMNFIKKKNLSNPDVYNNVMSKQLFSKCLNPKGSYMPEKKTIILLSIGLNLDVNETKLLLDSAGYSLHKNNGIDMIIEWCLKNDTYIAAQPKEKIKIINNGIHLYFLKKLYDKKAKEKLSCDELYEIHSNVLQTCKKLDYADVIVEIKKIGKINPQEYGKSLKYFQKEMKKYLLNDEPLI